MYSEHLVATVLALTDGAYTTGPRLDAALERMVVTVGRILAPHVGAPHPTDESVVWTALTFGVPAAIGTRGTLHVLADGRTALHLGSGRGAIETAGTRLVVLRTPEPTRYTHAYYLPNTFYGGLR